MKLEILPKNTVIVFPTTIKPLGLLDSMSGCPMMPNVSIKTDKQQKFEF